MRREPTRTCRADVGLPPKSRLFLTLAWCSTAAAALVFAQTPADSPQVPSPRCVVTGTATAGRSLLPGVALTITPTGSAAAVATTSTGLDGRYSA